MLRVNT